MANYEFAVSTQHSGKIKNPQEVVDVFQVLGYEESYISGDSEVFIGGYETPLDDSPIVFLSTETGKPVAVDRDGYIYNVENGEELDEDDEFYKDVDAGKYSSLDCMEYLQSQLLDGEVFALVEAGWEKLRSVGGTAVVISQDKIIWNSTYGFVEETIQKIKEKTNG